MARPLGKAVIIVGHRLQEALKNHRRKPLVGWLVGLGWVGLGWVVGLVGWLVGWLDECDNYGNLVVKYTCLRGIPTKVRIKKVWIMRL